MDDDLNLAESLGNIPDNLIGKTSPSLKIDEKDADDALSLGLSEMFASRGASNIRLVPNDERLAGIYNVADMGAQKEKQKRNTLKAAKLKATLGRDANEIIQCLKQAYTDNEISDNPGIMDFLGKYFLWSFFVDDPSAFDSCDQAKAMLQKLGRKSLYMLSDPRCSGCRNNEHDRCRLMGKRMIKGLDFTPKMFDEISGALRMRGLIKPDASVTSTDDIKDALSPKKEESVRMYNAPKLEITPKISLDDAMAQLHAQTNKNAEDEKIQKRANFLNDQAKPIAQNLLALIYKDAPLFEINRLIESQLLPENKKLSSMLYNKMNDNVLLKSGLVFPPIVFDSCKQAKSFMVKNNLKIPNVKSFAQCNGCNNQNRGCCMLLGGTLLFQNREIPEDERLSAIDHLFAKRKIPLDQVKKCKQLEKSRYLAGIREAHEIIDNQSRNKLASSNGHKTNSFVPSTKRFTDTNDALTSAINQVSAGVPISSVKAMLLAHMSKNAADIKIEEILYSLPCIRAEALDDCTCSRHQFKDKAVIIKASKCDMCQYSNETECLKTKLPYGTADLSGIISAQETPEAKEIMNMFHDPENILDVELYPTRTGLQIEMNPDSGNEYDLGKLIHTDLPDMTMKEMSVSVKPKTLPVNNLEIDQLGGGWDIGGCL